VRRARGGDGRSNGNQWSAALTAIKGWFFREEIDGSKGGKSEADASLGIKGED
jgi:hypothetical protein